MSIKNGIILSCVIGVVMASTSAIGGIMLKRKVERSTIVFKGNEATQIIEESNSLIDLENNKNEEDVGNGNEVVENEIIENAQNDGNVSENTNEVVDVFNNNDENSNYSGNEEEKKEDKTESDKNYIDTSDMNIAILGEMMMGGVVTENVNYIYSTSFKDVYMDINSADFTYANFSTNITNLDKIENAKSKYLVTKDVVSAFRALGIDCVSLASDHIVDFPSDILKNTISILEENDVFVGGRQNMPVYFEKGDKKVAIVSTNSVIIGTSKNYTKNDISVYSKENLEKNIKEAKESADIVIADIHWGREYVYGVTNGMREMAKAAIDCGADMVIGSHAAGVYPIVEYKGKPIIYSTGYLIGDSDLYVAKEGFIFDINISKDKKIDKITMTPLYVNNKKEVLKYFNYNAQKAKSCLELYNGWHIDNGLNSKIEDGKIVIYF